MHWQTVYLTNSTSVQITRSASTEPCDCFFDIVEYEQGAVKSFQRGIDAAIPASTHDPNQADIGITAVSTNKAAVHMTFRGPFGGANRQVAAQIVDSTTLRLYCYTTATLATWHVIEFY